ncbi:DUF4412 domain-containing protein [Mucilaginibacter lacusdianchii]|uniref:DUF4412 domain-containing protein n=1 Tax=Mucilaginibacter lacusdianchii TaxID=2684211 RepID=UPI00131AC6E5|nr:DUF4412 domain-containing protein [Mucilaginibacter sp. JXJ CY 39]
MNIKSLSVALGIALSATTMSASAQKVFTEGKVVYSASVMGRQTEATNYFKGDSSVTIQQNGPANIKIINNSKTDYFAVVVDVPVANIKKAAVATPAEVEEVNAQMPEFAFTPSTETKVINGFNCKKVVAKDSKSGKSYDIWITNDIKAPLGTAEKLFGKAGGFPVQFTVVQNGAEVTNILKSIDATKAPAGSFGIPAGFDRITLTELKAMSGGR